MVGRAYSSDAIKRFAEKSAPVPRHLRNAEAEKTRLTHHFGDNDFIFPNTSPITRPPIEALPVLNPDDVKLEEVPSIELDASHLIPIKLEDQLNFTIPDLRANHSIDTNQLRRDVAARLRELYSEPRFRTDLHSLDEQAAIKLEKEKASAIINAVIIISKNGSIIIKDLSFAKFALRAKYSEHTSFAQLIMREIIGQILDLKLIEVPVGTPVRYPLVVAEKKPDLSTPPKHESVIVISSEDLRVLQQMRGVEGLALDRYSGAAFLDKNGPVDPTKVIQTALIIHAAKQSVRDDFPDYEFTAVEKEALGCNAVVEYVENAGNNEQPPHPIRLTFKYQPTGAAA